MEYFMIALRTIFISIIMFAILRKKGKRDVRSLPLFDVIVFIMIAEIAVNGILTDEPLLVPLISIGILLIVQFWFTRFYKKFDRVPSVFKQKNERVPEHQHPIPLIIDGKIQEEQLKRINQTPLWIRQQMRKLGYRDIKSISYCALKSPYTFFVEGKREQ